MSEAGMPVGVSLLLLDCVLARSAASMVLQYCRARATWPKSASVAASCSL